MRPICSLPKTAGKKCAGLYYVREDGWLSLRRQSKAFARPRRVASVRYGGVGASRLESRKRKSCGSERPEKTVSDARVVTTLHTILDGSPRFRARNGISKRERYKSRRQKNGRRSVDDGTVALGSVINDAAADRAVRRLLLEGRPMRRRRRYLVVYRRRRRSVAMMR